MNLEWVEKERNYKASESLMFTYPVERAMTGIAVVRARACRLHGEMWGRIHKVEPEIFPTPRLLSVLLRQLCRCNSL